MIIRYLGPWSETKRATEAGWTQKAFLNNVGHVAQRNLHNSAGPGQITSGYLGEHGGNRG